MRDRGGDWPSKQVADCCGLMGAREPVEVQAAFPVAILRHPAEAQSLFGKIPVLRRGLLIAALLPTTSFCHRGHSPFDAALNSRKCTFGELECCDRCAILLLF